MTFSSRCKFPALLGALVFAVPLGLATSAGAQTKLKLVLNWKYQGPQGMFFLAEDRGYYKAEGLEVTLDQGNGSGAAVPLVANGTYDVGLKVNLTNMQPNLREQMLMQGQVDGVFGYVNTIRFSAKLMGVEDKQLRYINYRDYGMDLYSNAIIVPKKLTKEKPEAVRGLVRAVNRGLLDSLKDLDASVAAVAKREPLIKVDVERERFEATLKDEMNHPEIARIGLGNVDTARLKKSIDILVDANALPRTPSVDEIFTPAFLPPADDLPKKLF